MSLGIANTEDTIIAVASPAGRGAIGILRISGSQTKEILHHYTQSKGIPLTKQPRKMVYCDFIDQYSKAVIDKGVGVFYQQPQSYTGEDAAELFLHGNPLLLCKLIDTILKSGLARPARPGEFTQRAYHNKKIDLEQAEAIKQVINARNQWELAASQRNFLGGEVKKLSSRLRSSLISLKAEIEAEVDFSAEDMELGLLEKNKQDQRQSVIQILEQVSILLKRSQETETLCHGFQVAIAGPPNAGKSSLFNRILGWDRSIVSEEAGTTRDYVRESIELASLTVRFVDTAGIRPPQDNIKDIEQAGIHMAQRIHQQSHLLLHVIDGARSPYPLEELYQIEKSTKLQTDKTQSLIVLNKYDLKQAKLHLAHLGKDTICISCHNNTGLENLRQNIQSRLFDNIDPQASLLLEKRQQNHLIHTQKALERILELYSNQAPPEIITLELDVCLEQVGAITAPVDNEEILGRIFSLFCIGK